MNNRSPKETTVYNLFKSYYVVSIPALYAYSDTYSQLGVPQFANKEAQKAAMSELVPTELTPVQMVILYREGCRTFFFRKPENLVRVYDLIVKHLSNMRVQSEGLNTGIIPTDDLRDMDEFAEFIFNEMNNVKSDLAGKVTSVSKKVDLFGHRTFRKKSKVQAEVTEDSSLNSNMHGDRPMSGLIGTQKREPTQFHQSISKDIIRTLKR